MKKVAAVAVLIALGVGLFFVFKPRHAAPENSADATSVVSEKNLPIAATLENAAGVPAVLPAGASGISTNGATALATSQNPAATLAVSTLPPLTILDNARVAIKNYGTRFGENPVGTNPEITEALLGKNPKGVNFITAESGLRVNEQGEMVDAYGTPFFFHQISGQEMEIHSAGQDRKMWTFDDLVTR